ncbi:MAG: hypothetical protein ACOH16_07370 [Propionibacteriaceae bacterium]
MRKHLVVGCWARALVGTAVVVRTGFTVVADVVVTALGVVATGFVVVDFVDVGLADVVTVFPTTLVVFVAAVVWTRVTVIEGSCVV